MATQSPPATLPSALRSPALDVRVLTPAARGLRAALAAEGIRATRLDDDELLVEGVPAARVGEIALHAGVPLYALVPAAPTAADGDLRDDRR
jgi:hypothetical protein